MGQTGPITPSGHPKYLWGHPLQVAVQGSQARSHKWGTGSNTTERWPAQGTCNRVLTRVKKKMSSSYKTRKVQNVSSLQKSVSVKMTKNILNRIFKITRKLFNKPPSELFWFKKTSQNQMLCCCFKIWFCILQLDFHILSTKQSHIYVLSLLWLCKRVLHFPNLQYI